MIEMVIPLPLPLPLLYNKQNEVRIKRGHDI